MAIRCPTLIFFVSVASCVCLAATTAGQCQGAAAQCNLPAENNASALSKETLLLQTRSTMALSQSTSVAFADACGCTFGKEGWSTTKKRCHADSLTSLYEATRCQMATAPTRDACGCKVGEGWSTTIGRCHSESETDPREATGCDSRRVLDACGCIVGQEGWSITRSLCRRNSLTDSEEAAACRKSIPSEGLPTPPSFATPGACLCVFDIDRTLTGKQGDDRKCPSNRVLKGVEDHGYGGGDATLSQLSVAGVSSTFCNGCFLGICSAGHGSGSGSPWNDYILDHIMRSGPQDNVTARWPEAKIWSYGTKVRSPYVLGQSNKRKQDAVEGIRQWYAHKNIKILSANVYFFGDRTENIQPFQWKGFNSREVSCKPRDRFTHGGIGYCGATASEITRTSGNWLCS